MLPPQVAISVPDLLVGSSAFPFEILFGVALADVSLSGLLDSLLLNDATFLGSMVWSEQNDRNDAAVNAADLAETLIGASGALQLIPRKPGSALG